MDNVKFWYPVESVVQLMFDGTSYHKDVVAGEGHIVYMEVLLCKQSRERLKNEVGAKKHKVVSGRVEGIKLCEKCQQKFKENPNLAWQKWVEGARVMEKVAKGLPETPKLHSVNE